MGLLFESIRGYEVVAFYYSPTAVGEWLLAALAWYLTANLWTFLLILWVGTWAAVNTPYHRRRGATWGFVKTEPSWREAGMLITLMLIGILPALIWNMTPMLFRKVKALCK